MLRLFVSRDYKDSSKYDTGSYICIKFAGRLHPSVITIEDITLEEPPDFIMGTPTLYCKSTGELFTGKHAIDVLDDMTMPTQEMIALEGEVVGDDDVVSGRDHGGGGDIGGVGDVVDVGGVGGIGDVGGDGGGGGMWDSIDDNHLDEMDDENSMTTSKKFTSSDLDVALQVRGVRTSIEPQIPAARPRPTQLKD